MASGRRFARNWASRQRHPSTRKVDGLPADELLEPCLNALHKFCDDWHAKVKTRLGEQAASSTLLVALAETLAQITVDMNADDLMVDLFKKSLAEFRELKEQN